MMPDNYNPYKEGEEHQSINVKFVSLVRHSPGNEAHLHQILKSYLAVKGIVLKDNNEVEI